jgi:hypothetical protein
MCCYTPDYVPLMQHGDKHPCNPPYHKAMGVNISYAVALVSWLANVLLLKAWLARLLSYLQFNTHHGHLLAGVWWGGLGLTAQLHA